MAVNQQQLDYLGAMGIPVWISRDLPVPDLPALKAKEQERAIGSAAGNFPGKLLSDMVAVAPRPDTITTRPEHAARTVLPERGLQAANELIEGLQQTPVRQIAELAASLDGTVETKPQVVSKNLDGVGWLELEKAVSQCTACDLHEKRQHTVFGRGSQQPNLMIVGDIPRLLDEQQQQPFTGEAGQLLSNMLSHLGVNADTIYFTSLLKCRPPLDSSPQSNQAASCLSYLKQQIKLIQPPLVLLMGRSTARQVLGQDLPMVHMRQKVHQLEGLDARFIASYHPSYLLKQPRLKALVWQDLQFTKKVLTSNG